MHHSGVITSRPDRPGAQDGRDPEGTDGRYILPGRVAMVIGPPRVGAVTSNDRSIVA